MVEDKKKAKEGVIRWTDNIYGVAQHVKKTRPGTTDGELESNFPILKDLEYPA